MRPTSSKAEPAGGWGDRRLTASLAFLCLRPVALERLPGSVWALALVWLGGAMLLGLSDWLLPYPSYDFPREFAALGIAVLGGMLTAKVLDHGAGALAMGFAFCLAVLVVLMAQDGALHLAGFDSAPVRIATLGAMAWMLAACARLVLGNSGSAGLLGKLAALLTMMLTVLFGVYGGAAYDRMLVAHYESTDTDDYREIDSEALWTGQPELVGRALAQAGAVGSLPVIAIAAGGSQDIFAREAQAVGTLLQRRFAGQGQPVVLSNGWSDLGQRPLANRTNIAAVLAGIGEGFDPQSDLAVIYLTAHGGENASLGTDLPDYTQLRSVDAAFLADALNDAGITRRVVIISACYSGSWIEALKSPDTIVLTAARADRASFGCDDRREVTVYGEALLEGPLGQGASLAASYEALKKRIADAEAERDLPRSYPLAFVGENIRDVWNAAAEEP